MSLPSKKVGGGTSPCPPPNGAHVCIVYPDSAVSWNRQDCNRQSESMQLVQMLRHKCSFPKSHFLDSGRKKWQKVLRHWRYKTSDCPSRNCLYYRYLEIPFYLFQIKYSVEKFSWFRSDTRTELYYIPMFCQVWRAPNNNWFLYIRSGEPNYYRGPHELCIIAGGPQNQQILS